MQRKVERTPVGVIVGRFQIHELSEGHRDLINFVVKEHPRVVIVLGLAPLHVTRNNPLNFAARKQMISEAYPNIDVLYIKDTQSDEVWSKNLDKLVRDVIGPTQTATLYGSRDSFIQYYSGKFPTQELEADRVTSATEVRERIAQTTKNSPDFRAGVIYAAFNQYPKVIPTVDIAILSEDGKKMLLGRKPDEDKYRFIGGYAEVKGSYENDASRETQEETGLEIGPPEYVGSMIVPDWRYRKEEDKIKTILFKAKYIFGMPKGADDIAEVWWADIEKLRLAPEQYIMEVHLGLFELFVKKGLK
jgi:bifunctional NMN adenylyltransferase/nudix hydrolase